VMETKNNPTKKQQTQNTKANNLNQEKKKFTR